MARNTDKHSSMLYLALSFMAPKRYSRGTQEALKRHPRGTQKAPKRHSRGTQEALKRHSRGTQEALKRHSRGTQEALKRHLYGIQEALAQCCMHALQRCTMREHRAPWPLPSSTLREKTGMPGATPTTPAAHIQGPGQPCTRVSDAFRLCRCTGVASTSKQLLPPPPRPDTQR
jgi:hypothetical protein